MSGYKAPSYQGHYQSNVNHRYEQNLDYEDYESEVVPFSRYQEDYNGRYHDYSEYTMIFICGINGVIMVITKGVQISHPKVKMIVKVNTKILNLMKSWIL